MNKEIRQRFEAMDFVTIVPIEGQEITKEQLRAFTEKVVKYSAGWKRYGGYSRRMSQMDFFQWLKTINLHHTHICAILVHDNRCPVEVEAVKGVCKQILIWLRHRREYWKSAKIMEITGGKNVATF